MSKIKKKLILILVTLFVNSYYLFATTQNSTASLYLLKKFYYQPALNKILAITSLEEKSNNLFFKNYFSTNAPTEDGIWEFNCKLKDNTTYPGKLYATIKLTNEKTSRYKINTSYNQVKFAFPQKFEKKPIKEITLSGESFLHVISAQYRPSIEKETPIPADFYQISRYPSNAMRNKNYEFFNWTLIPSFIVFRFDNYWIQSKFLKRIAFFVEKEGYSGKILTDKDLEGKHGWNAHDYKSDDLAKFFQMAKEKSFQLNEQEIKLKNILLKHKIILKDKDNYKAGKGGIISYATDRCTSKYVQHLFLTHEGLHGIFFTEKNIRDMVKKRWKNLEEPIKNIWKLLFLYKEYDSTNLFLTENEFFAYSLTRPATHMHDYFFKDIIPTLEKQFPKNKNSIEIIKNYEIDFLNRESHFIENEIQKKYPIKAGDLRTFILIY